MVSDIILGAIIGGVIALSGAFLGLLAEPVRAHFARKAHQEQLRRILYGELIIKLQRAAAYLDYHRPVIERRDTDYLKSFYKVELSGPISFPDEVTAQEQYYQLTPQEFDLLATAYYKLRTLINGVNKFGRPPFDDAKEAMELCRTSKEMLEDTIYRVNEAFENNVHVLEKIDGGDILKAWRKFIQDPKLQKEYLSDPAKKALKEAAEKKNGETEPAEEPAEKKKGRLIKH
jgi:hypothetical protein